MYFRLMAAIFDLLVTPTWWSICNSSTVLLNPENVGVAVGISLLSLIQAKIYRTLLMCFRFMAVIFDLPVTPTWWSIYNNSTVLLDPENGAGG